MRTKVYSFSSVKDKIINGINLLADPVRGTVSPKGRNVLFTDKNGVIMSSNDGANIAKHIHSEDKVEDSIVEIVRSASLKTNTEAGDGTSTTILLSSTLAKEAFKQIDNGFNPMDLKKEIENFGNSLLQEVKKKVVKIKSDKDLFNIASISANNDPVIAEDIVRTVTVAGLDGMVFLEPNNKPTTEIIEDIGFNIQSGMFLPVFRSSNSKFTASYQDVPVLITDKRIYYEQEAEKILETVIREGFKSVVIVARDFIGDSVKVFAVNHQQGNINILLVKDPNVSDRDNETMQDLAIYLGGRVLSERSGSLVENLTINDFCMAGKVFADHTKSIFVSKIVKNKALADRVAAIRSELDREKNNEALKQRLASLTNGMVTIKVGGNTQIEVAEKLFRYEDAINATRAAMRDGYLVGGGISVFRSFDEAACKPELVPMFRRFCEANIRQIAENCGKHPDTIVRTIAESNNQYYGYNALTDSFEDLLKAGVVDPYKVTEMAIKNSISVVSQIISSDFIIVQEKDEEKN